MSIESQFQGTENVLHKIAAHIDAGTAPGTLHQACEAELDRELEKQAFNNSDIRDQRLGEEAAVAEYLSKVAMLVGLNEVTEQNAPQIMKVAFDQTVDSYLAQKNEVIEKVASLNKQAEDGMGGNDLSTLEMLKNKIGDAGSAIKEKAGGAAGAAGRGLGSLGRAVGGAVGGDGDGFRSQVGQAMADNPRLAGAGTIAAGTAGLAGLGAAGYKLNQMRKAKQQEGEQPQKQLTASQNDEQELNKLAEAVEVLRPYNVIDEEALNRL